MQDTKATTHTQWAQERGQLQWEAAAAAILKMELMSAWLLLLLFCFADSQLRRGAGLFVQDPEAEWERMVTVISQEMTEAPVPESKLWRSGGSSTPTAKNFPQFVVVPASKVQKEVFKPEKGARPLPKPIKDVLLGATVATPTMGIAAAAKTPLVEILCHIDRIYVRIRREVFKTRGAYKHLQLGSCPVNLGNDVHYYFLYLLKSNCGFKMEVSKSVLISCLCFDDQLNFEELQSTHLYVSGYCRLCQHSQCAQLQTTWSSFKRNAICHPPAV